MELCPALIEEGFRIEVETNGTLSPHGLPSAVHYNVSAKLANSYQPQSKRIKPSILKEFYSLHSVLKVRPIRLRRTLVNIHVTAVTHKHKPTKKTTSPLSSLSSHGRKI